jgi:hypothetical protein
MLIVVTTAAPMIQARSIVEGCTIPRAALVDGIIISTIISAHSQITVRSNHLCGLTSKSERDRDRQFKAIPNSIATNIRNSLDRAARRPPFRPDANPKIRSGICTNNAITINRVTSRVKTGSFLGLGSLLIRSASGGLKPKAMAGRPSVAKLM